MPAGTERGRPTAYGLALVSFVAIGPFLGFAQRNDGQITQGGRLAVYAALVAIASMAAFVVVVRRWGRDDPNRFALAVAAVVASFFGFSTLFDPDPTQTNRMVVSLVLWLVLTGALARLALFVGHNEHVRTAVLIFAVTMAVLPAVARTAGRLGEDPSIAIVDPGTLTRPDERPNVYWIVLDAYARPDVLRDAAGIDVGSFVEALEGQGFTVSTSSRASYPFTILSLASTLEMRYVLEPGHNVTNPFEQLAPVVVGRSSTTARFEALGYGTIYGPAGGVEWSACRPDLVDACLPLRRPALATGELEKALLDLTPLGTLSLPVPYSDPQTLVEGLADPDRGAEPPVFAFQHILTPHEPYRYRDDCSARAVPMDEADESRTERLSNYGTQVRCINDLALQATAEIVERDPTAIILIQSDHGTHFSPGPEDRSGSRPVDRIHNHFAALNAMRLPAHCQDHVEGAALVNTFRIVFACIEGREPELLDYRAFLHPWGDVIDMVELTPSQMGE